MKQSIQVRDGQESWRVADDADCEQGLAVHPSIDGRGFTLTHVRSWACFGSPNRSTEAECLTMRDALLVLPFDWHMSDSTTEVMSFALQDRKLL
jgi:hypothetical protein